VNGLAGFGVTDPAYRIDTSGQIRVRQGVTGLPAAGLHFHQATPNANRAFVGMASDTVMGLQGEPSNIWGLQMDTTTGNLGVKTAPTTSALTVNGATQLNGNLNATGNTALGHSAPGYVLDVMGRSRIRETAVGGTAGLWFYQSAPAADRALVGMANDNSVGFYSPLGAGWGLQMNTGTGDLSVGGRVWANNVHVEVAAANLVQTTTVGSYVQIPNMAVGFTLTSTRPVFFHFHLPGIEFAAGAAGSYTFGYRIMLYWPGNSLELAITEPVHNNVQYYHRSIVLTRIFWCGANTYTVQAEWYIRSNGCTLYGCSGGGERVLQVIEL
jgi:hypothetical protein